MISSRGEINLVTLSAIKPRFLFLAARGRVTLPTELSGLLYEYLIISLLISVCRKMVFLSSEWLATYLDELR